MAESETRDYSLRLISEVKRYPALYDNTHEDFRHREFKHKLWMEIAYRLTQNSEETSVNIVKNRWKALRDGLVKETRNVNALVKLKSGRKRKRKQWRYTNEMEFLIPYLVGSRHNQLKCDAEQDGPLNKSFKLDENEIYHVAVDSDCADETREIDENDIYTFFNGIADTVKKMTPENQAKVRKDVVNMVLDANLWETDENKDHAEKH